MIPIFEPYITDIEKKYVSKALESGWISSQGEFVNKFENEFAKFCGKKIFKTEISNTGLTWHHLPIKDYNVPNKTFFRNNIVIFVQFI